MAGRNAKLKMPSGWEKTRAMVLANEPLCRPCMMACGKASVATEVDHIKARAFGGSNDMDNLMPICTDCHSIKSGMEAAKARGVTYRAKLAFGVDGWPIGRDVIPYLARLVKG
jgi:5-methylcytosine-specific restriction endonuclease McrA